MDKKKTIRLLVLLFFLTQVVLYGITRLNMQDVYFFDININLLAIIFFSTTIAYTTLLGYFLYTYKKLLLLLVPIIFYFVGFFPVLLDDIFNKFNWYFKDFVFKLSFQQMLISFLSSAITLLVLILLINFTKNKLLKKEAITGKYTLFPSFFLSGITMDKDKLFRLLVLLFILTQVLLYYLILLAFLDGYWFNIETNLFFPLYQIILAFYMAFCVYYVYSYKKQLILLFPIIYCFVGFFPIFIEAFIKALPILCNFINDFQDIFIALFVYSIIPVALILVIDFVKSKELVSKIIIGNRKN